MKFPSFEHFAIDAGDFFSRLGIVFEPETEEIRNCESILEADKVLLLGHVGERNRTQQSVTDRKNTKNQDVTTFCHLHSKRDGRRLFDIEFVFEAYTGFVWRIICNCIVPL